MFTTDLLDAHGGWKRALGPQELELKRVVNHSACWELNLGPLQR